jgi:hypothetical protein
MKLCAFALWRIKWGAATAVLDTRLNLGSALSHYGTKVGLARTVYTLRIWPYIWRFPYKKTPYTHRMYIWVWPTLRIGLIHNESRLPVSHFFIKLWGA